MNELKNLDSIPDPRKKTGDKDAVNPDKFQKALKVEKADETDKREKRNRPRKQEELEDEQDNANITIPIPSGLFKEYMSGDEKKDSVLDISGGSKPHLVAEGSSTSHTKDTYIPEMKGDTPKSTVSVGISDNTSSATNPSEDDDDDANAPPKLGGTNTSGGLGDNTPAAPPPPPEEENTQTYEQAGYTENISTLSTDNNETDNTQTQQSAKKKKSDKNKTLKTKRKNEKTTKEVSSESSKPASKKASVKSSLKNSKTISEKHAQKGEKGTIKTAETKQAQEKTKINITDTVKGKVIKNDTSIKASDHKSDNNTPISAATSLSSNADDHQKDSNDDAHKNDEEITATPSIAAATPAGVPALQMSPFANIPKDVFELFEKMLGMMQVTKNNGMSITTITLNMPNSIFNKCQLILEHYDTAPNNYNVQFLGNPDAMNKFAQNLSGLNNAIAQSKLTFSIHLLPPKLSKAYSSNVTALGKESGDKEEKDGDETEE